MSKTFNWKDRAFPKAVLEQIESAKPPGMSRAAAFRKLLRVEGGGSDSLDIDGMAGALSDAVIEGQQLMLSRYVGAETVPISMHLPVDLHGPLTDAARSIGINLGRAVTSVIVSRAYGEDGGTELLWRKDS